MKKFDFAKHSCGVMVVITGHSFPIGFIRGLYEVMTFCQLNNIPISLSQAEGCNIYNVRSSSLRLHAENGIQEKIFPDIESDVFEYLLFIDHDIVFDVDDFRSLYYTMIEQPKDFSMISGAYIMPSGKICLSTTENFSLMDVDDFNSRGEIFEVQFCGLGFCMVHKRVFDTLGNKPFLRPFDDKNNLLTDDHSFCEYVRKAGFRIVAHPACRVKHEKLVPLAIPERTN